jgi:probable F420-dependent oxidoreductase
VPLRFTLHLGRFEFPGKGPALGDNLRRLARLAEDAGFHGFSVMDHVVQIPSVGPEWEDMPESTTTLGFLAAATERLRVGALVNGVTHRTLAQLGKQVATLDVLSGGRAFCGLGLAWNQREHELYGWDFPPVPQRYQLLEDALELLPLLWGPGSPRYEGRTVTVPEAICYPRPVQERIPIIVGGSGEQRTLRLVARHADGCNLFGDADEVRRKVAVLHRHCEAEGRDPAEVSVTQLSEAAVIAPGGERYADAVGTADEQVGRYRELADAGVDEVFVALHEDGTGEQVERFAEVTAAFR